MAQLPASVTPNKPQDGSGICRAPSTVGCALAVSLWNLCSQFSDSGTAVNGLSGATAPPPVLHPNGTNYSCLHLQRVT